MKRIWVRLCLWRLLCNSLLWYIKDAESVQEMTLNPSLRQKLWFSIINPIRKHMIILFTIEQESWAAMCLWNISTSANSESIDVLARWWIVWLALICRFVCLSINRISQNVMDEFGRNFVYILVVIRMWWRDIWIMFFLL